MCMTRKPLAGAMLLAALVFASSIAEPAPVGGGAQAQEPKTQPLAQGAVGMILGCQVLDSEGVSVGRLVDFVVNASGQPLAGVIDVGGFMGIGTHRVAVAWDLLRFRQTPGDVLAVVGLKRDEIAAAPPFRGIDTGTIVIGKPPK